MSGLLIKSENIHCSRDERLLCSVYFDDRESGRHRWFGHVHVINSNRATPMIYDEICHKWRSQKSVATSIDFNKNIIPELNTGDFTARLSTLLQKRLEQNGFRCQTGSHLHILARALEEPLRGCASRELFVWI